MGYAALIEAHGLKVPVPRTLSAVGPRHKTYVQDGWHIYTPRHAPPASLEGQLTFGLKYEGLDLWSSKPWFRQPDQSRSRPWSGAADRHLCPTELVSVRVAARQDVNLPAGES